MAGLTAIHRKGFKGGGMDASTKSFQDSYNKAGGPKSTRSTTKDSSVNVGAGGANTRGDAGRNDNLNVPSSDTGITQRQKEKYEKEFGCLSEKSWGEISLKR